MTRTIMKAVGAVAAGRNRKVHMKTVGVTIYCDEGSMGSNPAMPQKEAVSNETASFLYSIIVIFYIYLLVYLSYHLHAPDKGCFSILHLSRAG